MTQPRAPFSPRPAVRKNDRRTVGSASFSIADIENAGIDLFQTAERRIRPWLDRRQRFCGAGFCKSDQAELRGSKGRGHRSEEAAAMRINFFEHLFFSNSVRGARFIK